MPMIVDDDHFRQFAASLERAIAKYGNVPEEDLLERQKKQIETLVGLETQFRKTLISHHLGPGVYRAFLKFILEEKRNILAARPYFRERQEVFTKEISKALKARHEKSLYKFHFNYLFVKFVLSARKWRKGSKIVKLAEQIVAARQELIEMNMPLAISRARIFWSRTPKAQLSYMDLVQISCEGLMSAIDKFVLPYTPVFRAVAIGRMSGNFIEQYSETLVHFYPTDKRKIYRANKNMHKITDGDFEKLAAAVNEGADVTHRTTASEIAGLVAAASCVSVDAAPANEEGEHESIERYAADDSCRPDLKVENEEALAALRDAMQCLTTLERKLLAMRGVAVTL